jgi:thiamine-phosphate pyrophosphorylase
MLCLITNRRRLLSALPRRDASWPDVLFEQMRGAIAGGIDLIHIREPDIEPARLADIARRAVAIAEGTRTRVVVNDRLDIALAAATGVHLREDGIAPARARAMAPALLIGRSVHGVESVRGSAGADYLMAGSVFETVSKPGVAPLGVNGLAAIVGAAASCPVLAVGGVTAENLTAIRSAGAAGVAAIGAFVPSQQVSDLAAAVQILTKTLRIAFDS